MTLPDSKIRCDSTSTAKETTTCHSAVVPAVGDSRHEDAVDQNQLTNQKLHAENLLALQIENQCRRSDTACDSAAHKRAKLYHLSTLARIQDR
jgi:hypothetical protein